MPSKLYVGNLAYSVTNGDLEQLFSQAGQVQSAAVIMDKFSGQSKGFGFVEMANCGRGLQGNRAVQRERTQGPEHQGERGQTSRIELRRWQP